MRDDTIKRLRETLPPLLTLSEYWRLWGCCQASAYNDLKNKPGIAVKVGGSTRFVTDAVLDEMARLPTCIPQKDRVPKVKATAAKTTQSKKQTDTPRREHDREVRP